MGGPELLIPLMGIMWPMLALIVFIYHFFNSRLKIRLALIQAGRDASIFHERGDRTVNRLRTLKQGVVSLMAGFGLMVGSFLDTVTAIPDPIAYIGSVLLLIGTGLIAFYMYISKQPLEERESELIESL